MKNSSPIIIWRKSPSVETFIAQMKSIGHELCYEPETTEAELTANKVKTQQKKIQALIIDDGNKLEELKRNTELTGHLFILVEVDWYGGGNFQGLEIAKELMRHFGKGKVLNIHFVSFMSRTMVMKKNTDELLTIARQFQNIQLPIMAKQVVSPIVYSKNLYQLYWNNIFNAAFLYNLLGHNIKKLNPSSSYSDFENTVLLLKQYIASYKTPELIGAVEHLQLSGKAFSPVNTYEKIQKIRNLLALEVAKLGKLTGFQDDKNIKYKAMIVDDSITDISNLRDILDGYFDVQERFMLTNGEEAKKILNNYKNEELHAVFLDQELLDSDGGNQRVQGLDLYELLSTPKYKGLQLRIITSLSREAISIMYPDSLQIDKVLFKENGGYSVSEANLHKFFENLYSDINEGLNDELHGPSTGHFDTRYGLKQMYYDAKEKESLDDIIENITKTVNLFLAKKLSPGSIDPGTKKDATVLSLSLDEKKKYLEQLLLLRLIFLVSHWFSDYIEADGSQSSVKIKGLLFLHYTGYQVDVDKEGRLTPNIENLNNNVAFKKQIITGNKNGVFTLYRYYNNIISRLGFVGINEYTDDDKDTKPSYLYGFDDPVKNNLFPHEMDFLDKLQGMN